MITPHTKLHNLTGQIPARCFWLDMPSPMAAEIAGCAKPELCVIDTEHGQIGPETVTGMLRALDLSGVPALVRVGDAGAGRIKHALDAGAAGVIVPFIETAEEASLAVRAFCTPPFGTRGLAPAVSRAARYGADTDYARTWNDRGILALQIETRKGLANAGVIAAIEGVDMLFFGPGDFSMDSGLDAARDGDKIMAACRAVIAAAHSAGKLAGVFPWPDRGDPASVIAEGADLVAVGSDVRGLAQSLKAALVACPLPEK
ncbi:MAG TPA: aldolase/citrate lyase family protein [Thermohalobaculum sp.]|nr:aldolase/citrate lyase family protein [Thermohalobaculum sp.]